jgi:hypothetical protein
MMGKDLWRGHSSGSLLSNFSLCAMRINLSRYEMPLVMADYQFHNNRQGGR